MKPSALYRATAWKFGTRLALRMPSSALGPLCAAFGGFYWAANNRRRRIVFNNLLPGAPNPAAARRLTRKLFIQFAAKLFDLWRFESGQPIDDLFHEWDDWNFFSAAQRRNRGVLLLTPHLGNWEIGGPLLSRQGIKLHVITLAEPDSRLTELRKNARNRWGIETIVIGENPFAFVEVIRRLEAGATVALLVDRPHPASAVQVELFGRPFAASIAAAELARASGCALLPVYIVQQNQGYRARILPEIEYDRHALGQRSARRDLTQAVMRVFEPLIQQHLDQWYHFVPVWPQTS